MYNPTKAKGITLSIKKSFFTKISSKVFWINGTGEVAINPTIMEQNIAKATFPK